MKGPNLAPYISIVLPCHGVQAYLRQCLDSLLDESFDSIEVIGIDDASGDHSGAILDEYAARDPRVRAIHLEENVGLGLARNIGLDLATGEYVLFVDSDDWFADGAVQAIAQRLQQVRPDVLFFDYARAYWDGRRNRNILNHLFREPPAPDTFTLLERPDVMHLMMTAWNKAFRREFLLEHGFRFAPGFYEDLVVTYPSLMVAERISFLDRVCYYYRQRRGGAITKTSSRKHFAAFDQYQQIWDWMDSAGPRVDAFRALMFERMIWHYLVILDHPARVPASDREEFFLRITDHYRRFLPEGFVPPAKDAQRYALLARGSYRAFAKSERIAAAQKKSRRFARAVRRRGRSLRGKTTRRANLRLYRYHLRRPVDENLAIFACYWYRAPTGNPYGIYHELRRLAPHIRAVWVVSQQEVPQVAEGTEYVVAGTRDYYRLLARAKYLINDVNFPNFVVKRPDSIHVQTQHGTPLKTMGMDLRDFPIGGRTLEFKSFLERAQRWDYNVSSNSYSTEIWRRTYPSDFVSLDYGYPRNDRFYTSTLEEVASLRRMFGIQPGQTAILYAPTHREYRDTFEMQLNLSRVARALNDDQVLLLRAHYFYSDLPEVQDLVDDGLVINVSQHLHAEDVCLAADLLLTDYSSISFDFANLRRPIVLFADDYETYRVLRGTYFDLLEAPPGAVASTEDELIRILVERQYEDAEMWARLDGFRRRFCEFDDGKAGERIVRRVFLNEDPPPPVPLEQRTPAPPPSELRTHGVLEVRSASVQD